MPGAPTHLWLRRLLVSGLVLLGLFLVASVVLVAAGLREDLVKSDVGLVLGSKVERDGTPSARLRARLDKTLELYRAGYFPRVIVSGGVGVEGYDEAWVMRDYLAGLGIPPEKILVDSDGINTYQSGKYVQSLAAREPIQSVLVISQYFHVPRARLVLRRFGIRGVHSSAPRYFEVRDLYSTPREVIGYVQYALRRFQ